MKTSKIIFIIFTISVLCAANLVIAQESNDTFNSDEYHSQELIHSNKFKHFNLFVKMEDAVIERQNAGKQTWYTWKKALLNEVIPGQARGKMWCTLLASDQTIIKVDSVSWELHVKVTLLGDDGEKINISYQSFNIPNVNTESKKYAWMKNASCEAGGYFYRDGYMFRMKLYEKPQDFRFKRITATHH